MALILFDLDNTLYDTYGQVNTCRLAAIKAMIYRGLPGDKDELKEKLSKIIKKLGSNSEEHYDTLVTEAFKDKKTRLPIITAGVTAYNAAKQVNMKLYPDAIPTLIELRGRGHEIGILTQGVEKKQWDKINRLRLYDFFKGNISIVSDDKTKDEIIKNLMKKNKRIILVGDRQDSDIRAANNAGIISIQLMKGPYKDKGIEGVEPTYKINTLSELVELDILKELWS